MTVGIGVPRFDSKIVAHSICPELGDCWIWTANKVWNGYGRLRVDRRMVLAHRFAYETAVGPISDGLHLDHLCRNRACVNPAHLEPVTPQENVLRGAGIAAVNSSKTQCRRGHDLAGDNLYLHPRGDRVCRTCRAESQRRYEAKQGNTA